MCCHPGNSKGHKSLQGARVHDDQSLFNNIRDSKRKEVSGSDDNGTSSLVALTPARDIAVRSGNQLVPRSVTSIYETEKNSYKSQLV